MGVLADQMRDVLDRMRESDERLTKLTRDHITRSRQLIAELDCESVDPIKDAIELLESHGYKVTAPR